MARHDVVRPIVRPLACPVVALVLAGMWLSGAGSGHALAQPAPPSAARPAAEPPAPRRFDLPPGVFDYLVIDQELTAALQEFGRHFRLQVEVDPEVRGRIRGRMPPGSAREFLDRLAEQNQFDWFYDGQVLRVTPLRQTNSRLVPIVNFDVQALRSTLQQLGVSEDRYPLWVDANANLLRVSGPPRFVEMVEQTIAALQRQRTPPANPQAASAPATPPGMRSITIFRGQETSVVTVPP